MAVMVLAAMATAGLVSCQKEKTDEGQTTQQNPTDKAVVERIKEFKRQVEYHKSHPGLRDATCVSVEEAVWNLEALFNFTYAYPELCYGKTVAADTVLSLPLSANDSVRMTDLVTFYGMVYAAAAAIYQNVDLPDKQFIVLDVEEGECQSSHVAIHLHTLQGRVVAPSLNPQSPSYAGPFPTGISGGYTENMGNSQGQHVHELCAADTLSMVLNAELVPVAPEGCWYSYTGIVSRITDENTHYPFSHSLYYNVGSYCEFYKENPVNPDDFWLTSSQMNFHFFGERSLVLDTLPSIYPVILPEKELFFINIENYDENSTSAIGHKTTARYGIRVCCSGGDGDKEPLE